MSAFVTVRLLDAALLAAVIVYRFIAHNRANTDRGKSRWIPVFDPMFLVSVFLAFFLLSLILDRTVMLRHFGACLCEVLITATVYFTLLLPALPLLRRWFSARACAMLWLLPNILYSVANGALEPRKPLLMLPVRGKLDWLIWVWLAGAIAVMVWKVAEHIRFRRALLRDAYEPDEETLALFRSVREEMEEEAALEEPLPLLVSPRTATPLSVGLWRKTLRVVLPERSYTPDELRLIFRHELIHIARMDAGTKLFMTCCAAAMWWNPLQWLAMRRCADDLELGCDEFVLLEEPEDMRSRYADLLLKTAGDERGFTTCLSATAEALRYRLENVLHPRKRLLGGVMLGVVTMALIVFSGSFAVGYAPQRLDEAVFAGMNAAAPGEWYVHLYDDPDAPNTDAAALWEALRAREVYLLAGNYRPDTEIRLCGYGDGRSVEIDCAGRYVFADVHRYDVEKGEGGQLLKSCFVFAEEPDWDALLAGTD